MNILRTQILAAAENLNSAFTYEALERKLPKQPMFSLAIELCRMQEDGVLFFKAPSSYVCNIPVYSLKSFKRAPTFPRRTVQVEVGHVTRY